MTNTDNMDTQHRKIGIQCYQIFLRCSNGTPRNLIVYKHIAISLADVYHRFRFIFPILPCNKIHLQTKFIARHFLLLKTGYYIYLTLKRKLGDDNPEKLLYILK